eukprot:15331766-Ditylum_brightwellii.AAC.1
MFGLTPDVKGREHPVCLPLLHKDLDGLKKGILYKLDPSLGIQCYVDADFAGIWSKADANNPENVVQFCGSLNSKQKYSIDHN